MSALVLDRCLWAMGCSGAVPTMQLIHPFAKERKYKQISYEVMGGNLNKFLISYGARGDVKIKDNSLVGLSAKLSVKTAGHQSNSEKSLVLVDLTFLATRFLALSVVSHFNQREVGKYTHLMNRVKSRII